MKVHLFEKEFFHVRVTHLQSKPEVDPGAGERGGLGASQFTVRVSSRNKLVGGQKTHPLMSFKDLKNA
jgi:hypothetical protein